MRMLISQHRTRALYRSNRRRGRRVDVVRANPRACRTDLDALIDAAENAADIASVRAWYAYVAAVGRDAAIANSYTCLLYTSRCV